MSDDDYAFVCVDENVKEDGVEIPVEEDGAILLSALQSQFSGASGLKYRNPLTGTWRAVKMVDGSLRRPDKGWADTVYVVVSNPNKEIGVSQPDEAEAELGMREKVAEECQDEFMPVGYSSDSYKRKLEDGEGQRASKNPRSQSPDNYGSNPKPASNSPTATAFGGFPSRNQEDLIILGLAWTVTDQELRTYFEQFGTVAHCEVKKDLVTGKSRGFGFVRYGDRAVQASVFGSPHTIKGRRVELKYPKQSTSHMPNKLFIGCLPLKPEVTNNELTEHFSQFGRLSDVYIPKPYRGFGFVTFTDPVVAHKIVNMRDHTIRKSNLNVSFADPRGGSAKAPQFPAAGPFGMQMGYSAAIAGRHPVETMPRYPFSGQQQQQQAYALGYGPPQHMAAAIQRPDASHNPAAMGAVHAVPVSATPGMTQASPGLYAVSYGNGAQQPPQQPFAAQSPGAYR